MLQKHTQAHQDKQIKKVVSSDSAPRDGTKKSSDASIASSQNLIHSTQTEHTTERTHTCTVSERQSITRDISRETTFHSPERRHAFPSQLIHHFKKRFLTHKKSQSFEPHKLSRPAKRTREELDESGLIDDAASVKKTSNTTEDVVVHSLWNSADPHVSVICEYPLRKVSQHRKRTVEDCEWRPGSFEHRNKKAKRKAQRIREETGARERGNDDLIVIGNADRGGCESRSNRSHKSQPIDDEEEDNGRVFFDDDTNKIYWEPTAQAKALLDKVSITDVTSDALTITVKECTTNEGFFSSTGRA